MVKKTMIFSNYKLDVSYSKSPSHPDKFKLSIYCRNNKTNEYLRSDNFHLDGKWPFHVHDPDSNGRKYNLVIGGGSPLKDHIQTYLDLVMEKKLMDNEQDFAILGLNISIILLEIIKDDLKKEKQNLI